MRSLVAVWAGLARRMRTTRSSRSLRGVRTSIGFQDYILVGRGRRSRIEDRSSSEWLSVILGDSESGGRATAMLVQEEDDEAVKISLFF